MDGTTATTIDWHEAQSRFSEIIASSPEDLQVRATLLLARFSNHAPRPILSATAPLLVDLLSMDSCPSLQRAAAHCLTRLARHSGGALCPLIGRLGAIPYILRLLPAAKDGFLKSLLRCLAALVTFDGPNRTILARNFGLQMVLCLISSCGDDMRRYLLEILSALALLREVRRSMVDIGGLDYLVEAVSSGKMFSRTQAAHAVGLLAIAKRVRTQLVEFGAISALAGLLRDGDAASRMTAGNALGIISSHVEHLRLVARSGAIPLYAEMLEGSEMLGKEIAEDVFCVLAVAEENAVSIIEHMVRILQGNNEEAKGVAIDVLWDLADYKHSLRVLCVSGAIALLLELLRDGNGDIRVKACGVAAQLSYDEVNRGAMAEEGTIPVLIGLLRGDSEELKEYAAEALVNFSEDPRYQERVSEVFEIPSFLTVQERLIRIRNSDDRTTRAMGLMSVEQLTSGPDLF